MSVPLLWSYRLAFRAVVSELVTDYTVTCTGNCTSSAQQWPKLHARCWQEVTENYCTLGAFSLSAIKKYLRFLICYNCGCTDECIHVLYICVSTSRFKTRRCADSICQSLLIRSTEGSI